MADIFGTISDAWNKYTPAGILWNKRDDIVNAGIDAWNKYTPAGIVYNTVKEPVSDAIDAVKGAGDTVNKGIGLIRRYWYVPVIVGGVVVAWRVVGSVKTAAMLKALVKG